MAMISIKNLVAPVSNLVHLMTIFVVVVVFAVWRWSGGNVNFIHDTRSSVSAGYDRQPSLTQERERPSNDSRSQDFNRESNSKNTIVIPDEAADDLLHNILKKPVDQSANKIDKGRKNRPSNSLEDIERSLGITK